ATVLDDTIDVTFETERLELMKMIQERSEEDSYGVRDPFPVQFSQAVDSTSLTKASTLRSSKGSLVNGLRFEVDRNDPSRFELRAEGDKWWYNEDYTLSISEDLIPQGGNLALEEPIEITFRTESFLVFDTEWSVIQKDIILTEDGSFYLGTMENWKSDRLLRSLRLDPPGELVIGTQRGRFFTIQLDEDSQKRENILLVLEDKGGENEKAVVREPSVYTLKHAPSLRLTMNDRDEQVCFYSNNALGQKTFLESTLEGVVKSNSLTWDEGSDCSKREEYAFQYSFGKNVLEPQKSHTIYLHAYDIYGQQETQKYIVQARALNPTERVLLRQESEFYQFFHSAEDLVFPYDVENIPEVKVEICRLSAGQAVQIETTYEQRWYSFTPSTEKCLGYSAFSQTLKSNWGTQIQEEVRLDQNMKEIVQGLYYVRISLPSRSLKEDAELMADGVLEYTHWNLMTKRGESTLAWLIDSDENKPISGADITLFGGDGERLYGGKTDDRGILLVDKNRFKHEFVMAKINEKEILLNAFSQQGFEPERFSILFNADESPYRYQFYIQE
ncbi:MAG: hypothetical protein U1C97_03685, partial [Candidatus Gracilibacteria bacterium]|nr:hypothetical protein [Candidatus Gracilibacteria bacterium]